MTLVHKGFDETRRLGVKTETEQVWTCNRFAFKILFRLRHVQPVDSEATPKLPSSLLILALPGFEMHLDGQGDFSNN
jgi:hypothetical protein